MERYSRWRDPGTGIQPFLTPVPPRAEGSLFANAVTGLRYGVAVLRLMPILVCVGLYTLTVEIIAGGLSAAGLTVISRPLHRVFTKIWTRLILLFLGAIRFDVKRSSSSARGKLDFKKTWAPKAGDVIVSNWVSWIEILWFAYKFDPIFIVPASAKTASASQPSPVLPMSLRSMLGFVGHTPIDLSTANAEPFSVVQKWAKHKGRPLVLFPEGTTTNGRGVMKFIDVFGSSAVNMGKDPWSVWIACVKYPTPTTLAPSATHSIPSQSVPVIPHLLTILSTFPPILSGLPTSFHLLSPLDAPNPQMSGLTEACAKAVSSLGRLKRVGYDFDDKHAFFGVYFGGSKKGTTKATVVKKTQ